MISYQMQLEPPQLHQKYYTTQYEELGISSLNLIILTSKLIIHVSLGGWENVFLELVSERVRQERIKNPSNL